MSAGHGSLLLRQPWRTGVSAPMGIGRAGSFNCCISPSNEYSGLISFRMDWLDPLAVQGTLKTLLQHHSSKASILQHSAFFIVQLSHPYMTTGKTIALTRWAFVGKVMSLLFNMLFRLVITFAFILCNPYHHLSPKLFHFSHLKLYPLNMNFAFLLPPDPGNHFSVPMNLHILGTSGKWSHMIFFLL